MAKGYKVVSEYEGMFCSCRMRPTRQHSQFANATHFYQEGIPTYPRPEYGPLAVFGRLKDAKFANKDAEFTTEFSAHEKIFRCIYTPSKVKGLRFPACQLVVIGDWHHIPETTKFASSVTLLKEVK